VIFYEGLIRLDNMTETINEQILKLQKYLVENHLSHKTNLNLPSSRPEVSLCDDDEYPFRLESDCVVDTTLTNLKKVIDASLTSLSLVALS